MDEAAKREEIQRLLQLQRIGIIEKPTANLFVCVYLSEDVTASFQTFSYLLPLKLVEAFLQDVGWSQRPDDFRPRMECAETWEPGGSVCKVYYLRDGNEAGAQALVHQRHFWGLRPPAIEIAEEFRLFHNLYYNEPRRLLLHCDVHGVEHEVVRIKGCCVEVQLRFLTEFLQAKQMHLAIQWEGSSRSSRSLDELGLEPIDRKRRGTHFHWELCVSGELAAKDHASSSRLLGKALLLCPGAVEYRDTVEEDCTASSRFIIAHDVRGQPVEGNCDPRGLGDDARLGLQPVFFRRSVLRKYFDDPAKFSVDDGYLRCGSLWGLRMDNDHPRYVIVFLRDLQVLPPAERAHWRSFNLPPDGSFSETFRQRNIHAWFADPKMADLRLKALFPRANQLWQETYGWLLWREPEPQDKYVIRQVHVCLDEEQAEFDQQNGLLAKLLNDSLNIERIEASLHAEPVNKAGLKRLQQFLLEAGHPDADYRVGPLRIVQDLRSTGSAHRKGHEYSKALQRAGLAALPLVEASMKVFAGAVEFIEWLRTRVLKDAS